MIVEDFRDLRVWQEGMDQVVAIYHVTEAFPAHELYGLTSQLRRAAVSVPSNIAEGKTRSYLKEYIHHVSVGRGSLAEVRTQIEIAYRLGYASPEAPQVLNGQALALARQLTNLKNSLANKQ